MSEFDLLFDTLGSFGPFQRQVFILVNIFETPVAWAMLLPVFIGATPGWWCQSEGHDKLNNTDNNSANGSFFPNSSLQYMQCVVSNKTCPAVLFDEEFSSIVTQFGLVCDKKYVSDLITTLQMVGLIIGATTAGQLADLFGRKRVLFLTYLLLLMSSTLSAFANSWILYGVIRLVVGASIGGHMIVNFILPIEYVGVKWRTFCGCVGFWAIGVMTLPVWAYFVRDWRHLCIATSCAGIPLLGLWWFIPESCRWLVTRGRYEEAEKLIVKIAKRNNAPIPDFSLLRSFAKSEADVKNQQKMFSYWHLCMTPKSALWTFICMYGWFASSSVYYGLSYNLKNLSGDRYLNMFYSGAVELPALLFVLCVNNRIGRRWTVFILFLVSGLSLLSIMLVDWLSPDLEAAVLALAMLGKSTVAGGWAAVQIFSAEKFPTMVRNIGIASCSFAARIGGVISPQIVFTTNITKQLPFVIFGSISLLCAVLMLFVTETANLPLQDKLVSLTAKTRQKESPADCLPLQQNPDGKPHWKLLLENPEGKLEEAHCSQSSLIQNELQETSAYES